MTCPFCDHSHSFLESSLALARLDKYPVSPGHTLVTTKRHISSYFEATSDEVSGLWQLVGEVRQHLDSKHHPCLLLHGSGR
jgi:diadenosine tetraphosphate (Ap4A) HIT family hydrolase